MKRFLKCLFGRHEWVLLFTRNGYNFIGCRYCKRVWIPPKERQLLCVASSKFIAERFQLPRCQLLLSDGWRRLFSFFVLLTVCWDGGNIKMFWFWFWNMMQQHMIEVPTRFYRPLSRVTWEVWESNWSKASQNIYRFEAIAETYK